MYVIALGSQDAPLLVILSENPQAELEGMQRRRADVVRLYHQARVAEQVAATTLEYVRALLSDWKIERKHDLFAVAPDDAATLIDRGIVACALPEQPSSEKRPRARTDIPLKVAKSLQDLAETEGVLMADLVREAVVLLFQSRNLPPPTWKRHD